MIAREHENHPVYLCYLDESGNTGMDLANPSQRVFVLGGLIVPASSWREIEVELRAEVDHFFGALTEDEREIHTHNLMSGSKPFRQFGRAHCLEFQQRWMSIAAHHKLGFYYRSIIKKQFKDWLERQYGKSVLMNPHAMAFPLVSHALNQHLKKRPDNPLGILISDEHKELSSDLEKSLRLLQRDPGSLQHDRIIEKCFFIDSTKSLLLQLCDMCAYHARKKEEQKLEQPIRTHHQAGIDLLEPLILERQEPLQEIIGLLNGWMIK